MLLKNTFPLLIFLVVIGLAAIVLLIISLYRLKKKERELFISEKHYRELVDYLPIAIFEADLAGVMLFSNEKAHQIFGIDDDDIKKGVVIFDLVIPEDRERARKNYQAAQEGVVAGNEYTVLRKDGSTFPGIVNSTPIYRNDEMVGMRGAITDLSEIRRTEKALRSSEALFANLAENAPIMLCVVDKDNHIIHMNQRGRDFLGLSETSCSITSLLGRVHADDQKMVVAFYQMAVKSRQSLYQEYRIRNQHGNYRWVLNTAVPRYDSQGIFDGYMDIALDISERKKNETELLDLNRALKAILECNRALVRTGNETELLQEICRIIVETGGYLFTWVGYVQDDPERTVLPLAYFGHEDGYLKTVRVRLNDPMSTFSPQAQAIQSLLPVIISDIEALPDVTDWKPEAIKRGYRSVVAMPLSYKGEVFGNLGIYNDKKEVFTRAEVALLEALGHDLAFGIHTIRVRASRNETMQRLEESKADIELSYEATLEGWTRALELREKETAGHSQRVVEGTLALARYLGIGEDRIAHIRRGALLHDIGKLGIPDAILLKPGPLTDKEWEVMRLHPTYAYQVLHNIPYLAPARNIPYCHHERWDGTGYPRGLKGIDIPLEARIFSVVDVWDALTSDRPYRKAWRRDVASAYIREQAGKLFDPDVIAAFFELKMA